MSTTLRMIKESDLETIMYWRMSDSVTRYMNTNPTLTMETQKKWLNSLEKDESKKAWIVEVNGTPAGLIQLIEIDWENRSSSWGYFIGETKLRSLSLAVSLEMSLYDYVFDKLGFSEIHNETFTLNEGVWKLHMACGCKVIGIGKGEIQKDGISYDIVHLSITKDEWYAIRSKKKYEKINFDVWHFSEYKPHHLGIAVADIQCSISVFQKLGWYLESGIVEDIERNVQIAFMKHPNNSERIELISPLSENSPVTVTLKIMKNVASPYHICYETDDLEKSIADFKHLHFHQITSVQPAIAFSGQRVVFFIKKETGLIEIVEASNPENGNGGVNASSSSSKKYCKSVCGAGYAA